MQWSLADKLTSSTPSILHIHLNRPIPSLPSKFNTPHTSSHPREDLADFISLRLPAIKSTRSAFGPCSISGLRRKPQTRFRHGEQPIGRFGLGPFDVCSGTCPYSLENAAAIVMLLHPTQAPPDLPWCRHPARGAPLVTASCAEHGRRLLRPGVTDHPHIGAIRAREPPHVVQCDCGRTVANRGGDL